MSPGHGDATRLLEIARRTEVAEHDSPLGRWRAAACRPRAPLDACIEVFWCVEGLASYQRERILPKAGVELMLSLGPAARLIGPGHARVFRRAWLAGPQRGPLLVESEQTRVVAIRFRPGGAWPLLGLPLVELADRVLDLEDLLGAIAARLRERLLDTTDLVARFAALEEFALALWQAGPRLHSGVSHALERLAASDGAARIAPLALEAGLSHERLTRLFQEQVGLSPRSLGRLLRFGRLLQSLDPVAPPRWSERALEAGYFDQSHFNRDFRAFTGLTPGEYLARRAPDGAAIEA